MRALLGCACALLLTASTALAQFDSATVVGTVRDSSNAVVPAAQVTLTSVETGISVVKTSADNGSFEFPAVKPGVYVVTAEKPGFALALVETSWSRSAPGAGSTCRYRSARCPRRSRCRRRRRSSRPTPASAAR